MKTILLLLCFVTPIYPEASRELSHSGAWTNDSEPVTVHGNILSYKEYSEEKGQEKGVKLNLSTEAGDIQVLLGPRWVRFKNELNLTQGEPVTIVGLRFSFQKRPKIVAHEIISHGKKIDLREPSKPLKH